MLVHVGRCIALRLRGRRRRARESGCSVFDAVDDGDDDEECDDGGEGEEGGLTARDGGTGKERGGR